VGLVARRARLLLQELEGLGFDLDTLLAREPRLLLNAEVLAALRGELEAQLGEEDAANALLQLGFVNGLCDALTVLRTGFAPLEPPRQGKVAATRLAIQLAPPRGRPEWSGAWPEALEARALGERGAPACQASAGYTSGWLTGILGTDVLALEQSCRSAGHADCEFVAREAQAWKASGDARALAALDALPFAALQEMAVRLLPEPDAEAEAERYEPGSPVIHVWGPVMVLPFAGSDESLRSLELLARDPAARAVRVVIVDLSGAVIDEGFGAAGLDRLLEAVEASGAEPLLTGISPLSEHAVADLEKTRLVIRKDLPEAIAIAFQIADAQRRTA
jgi:anti-anti-sigma regulatory factor